MSTPLNLSATGCIRSLLSVASRATTASPKHQPQLVRLLPASYKCLHSSAAANSAAFPKKQITLTRTGDTSSKKWKELSRGQKVVRTASTGANTAIILVGILFTGAVFTFVYLEIMAPDSVTNWFNRAHDRVKNDPQCIQLLGGGRIKAYGEPTYNRWARSRPIASSVTTDRYGVEHLRIHFNVEGDLDKGVVNIHLIKRAGQSEHEYKHLFLDVAGRSRVYLENADDTQLGEGGAKKGFLGVRWR